MGGGDDGARVLPSLYVLFNVFPPGLFGICLQVQGACRWRNWQCDYHKGLLEGGGEERVALPTLSV